GQVNAVGLEETLPEGWTFVALVSGVEPVAAPFPGEGGLLEFAWFPLPPFPLSFTYRARTALEGPGTVAVTGEALILTGGDEVRSPNVSTTMVREGDGPFHSADITLSG